jgi:hypothetical protein
MRAVLRFDEGGWTRHRDDHVEARRIDRARRGRVLDVEPTGTSGSRRSRASFRSSDFLSTPSYRAAALTLP